MTGPWGVVISGPDEHGWREVWIEGPNNVSLTVDKPGGHAVVVAEAERIADVLNAQEAAR